VHVDKVGQQTFRYYKSGLFALKARAQASNLITDFEKGALKAEFYV